VTNRSVAPASANPLLDTRGAAAYLGLRPATLESWRYTGGPAGGGPPYIALGRRRIRYRRADLDAWLESRTRRSTSDPGPGDGD
jgi:predicted DNA-binding transcriptional regulator AlpA